MLDSLHSYINNIHPISDEATKALDKGFEIIEVPKRQLLLKDGETCHYLYFVLDGLMRMYYIKNEEEVSSLFC